MSNNWSKKVIEKLQEKNAETAEHKNVRAVLFELAKSGGYVLKPIRLIKVFYDWLNKNHKSKMNVQEARNMADVFSVLCHVYFIAGEKYKIQRAFAVSQSLWAKFCIGRTALENSLGYLKEMNIVSFYNYCVNGDRKRRKRMYIINRLMLEYFIKQAKEKNLPDELDYDDWCEYKGKKKSIVYVHSNDSTKLNSSKFEYSDINELLDDGFYFC